MIARPLLMSGAMVRAILREIRAPGTGKTMTRRLGHAWLKWLTGPARPRWLSFTEESFAQAVNGRSEITKLGPEGRVGFRWTSKPIHDTARPVWLCEPIVQPGDVLWIRETWRAEKAFDGIKPTEFPWPELPGLPLWFEADGPAPEKSPWGNPWGEKRVSLHLPARGARIKLTVTDVKLEPLQAITEEDALAEGVCSWVADQEGRGFPADPAAMRVIFGSAKYAFGALWESLHGAGSWGALGEGGPLVVAISFKPELIERNVASAGALATGTAEAPHA